MRHRHLILALRAEHAISGMEWVETQNVARRALSAFGDLSAAEENDLAEGTAIEERTRAALEMLLDLAKDGTFLDLRPAPDEVGKLQCRLTKNGVNMASDLMK